MSQYDIVKGQKLLIPSLLCLSLCSSFYSEVLEYGALLHPVVIVFLSASVQIYAQLQVHFIRKTINLGDLSIPTVFERLLNSFFMMWPLYSVASVTAR